MPRFFSGLVFDDSMGDEVQMTVIATGIDREHYSKVIRLEDRVRDVSEEEEGEGWTVRAGNGMAFDGADLDPDSLDMPAFMRNKVEDNPFGDIREDGKEEKKRLFPPCLLQGQPGLPDVLEDQGVQGLLRQKTTARCKPGSRASSRRGDLLSVGRLRPESAIPVRLRNPAG